MECRVCFASGELWGRAGGCVLGGGGESEHDLALLVNEFLENENSDGTEPIYSSDSDSGVSDPTLIAIKISYFKIATDQYELDLFSVVNSLVLSIRERDLHISNLDPCNASCIRFALVKLLRFSGYDAGVCTSRWEKSDKVHLGGDHEYIDVVHYNKTGITDRLIIDVDFRSHFEIARAVDSYDRILNSLPVIYVGSFTKLQQFLEVMAEAAIFSLKQNSMPLPPWRSYAYLEAKWKSPYQRKLNSDNINFSTNFVEHEKCAGRLKRLHSLLKSEFRVERLLKPLNSDRKVKLERHIRPDFTL